MCVLALLNIAWAALTSQPSLPPLLFRLVTQLNLCPRCQNLPRMHCPLSMESWLHCCLCRWKRSEGDSGQYMKTSKKCDNYNKNLYFTPIPNYFHEFHHMQSILIDVMDMWAHSSCMIYNSKVDQSVDLNSVTSKVIITHLSIPLPICLGSYTMSYLLHQYCLKNLAFIQMLII